MTPPDSFSSFPTVDRAANPHTLVSYLTTVSSLESVRDYKQFTYELLKVRLGDRILDVGCGAGDDVRALSDLVGREGKVTGVDLSGTMVAQAKRRAATGDNQRVEFREGNAHNLPFPDATFDGCRADRVLQHLDAPQQAVLEMARVTRAGGSIAVSEPDWDTLVIDAPDRELARKIIHFHCDGVRQGWIGRQLPLLFRQAALEHIAISFQTLAFTDVVLADQVLGVRTAASRAVTAGAITSDEADAWNVYLTRSSKDGSFFCALTGVAARASKPPV